MNTITTAQAAEFLQAHDNYLILTHVRPDGDTIGCAAGLCRALRQAGKAAYILENPEVTELFTDYIKGLTIGGDYTPETVVSVDIAARSLFPGPSKAYLWTWPSTTTPPRSSSPRPPVWTANGRPAVNWCWKL